MTPFLRFLLARVAFAVFTIWLVFTAMFAMVELTDDPNAVVAGFGSENQEEIRQQYIESRDRDRPVIDRYADWVGSYASLDMGWSYSQNRPVDDALATAGKVTAMYTVPATILATVASVVLGYYSASNTRSRTESGVRIALYAMAAVPAFLAAAIALNLLVHEHQWYTGYYSIDDGLFARRNLETLSIPGVLMAVALFGAQARYVRSKSAKYRQMEFVRLTRTKGGGPLVVAKHVLRNAAIPLVSITFVELLSFFALSVLVIELIFEIPGLGWLTYVAIDERDTPLLLGVLFVPIVFGLVGNLIGDAVEAWLDPRVDLG